MSVPPYKEFFKTFKGKKMPAATPFREFLVRDAHVPSDRTAEAIDYISQDAATASILRGVKGSNWIDFAGTPTTEEERRLPITSPRRARAGRPMSSSRRSREQLSWEGHHGHEHQPVPPEPDRPRKVFIAHGKNRTPLDQLKKALDQFKVKYAVAVDEPNKGRPISKKGVADSCARNAHPASSSSPPTRGSFGSRRMETLKRSGARART